MLGGQYLSHELLSSELKKNFEVGILETIAETYLEFTNSKTINVQVIPVAEDLRREILINKKNKKRQKTWLKKANVL